MMIGIVFLVLLIAVIIIVAVASDGAPKKKP